MSFLSFSLSLCFSCFLQYSSTYARAFIRAGINCGILPCLRFPSILRVLFHIMEASPPETGANLTNDSPEERKWHRLSEERGMSERERGGGERRKKAADSAGARKSISDFRVYPNFRSIQRDDGIYRRIPASAQRDNLSAPRINHASFIFSPYGRHFASSHCGAKRIILRGTPPRDLGSRQGRGNVSRCVDK